MWLSTGTFPHGRSTLALPSVIGSVAFFNVFDRPSLCLFSAAERVWAWHQHKMDLKIYKRQFFCAVEIIYKKTISLIGVTTNGLYINRWYEILRRTTKNHYKHEIETWNSLCRVWRQDLTSLVGYLAEKKLLELTFYLHLEIHLLVFLR